MVLIVRPRYPHVYELQELTGESTVRTLDRCVSKIADLQMALYYSSIRESVTLCLCWRFTRHTRSILDALARELTLRREGRSMSGICGGSKIKIVLPGRARKRNLTMSAVWRAIRRSEDLLGFTLDVVPKELSDLSHPSQLASLTQGLSLGPNLVTLTSDLTI